MTREKVRFLDAVAIDSNNNVIICDHCDSIAGMIIQGETQRVAFCSDHSPYEQNQSRFVYIPPENLEPRYSDSTKILNNIWIVTKRDLGIVDD